MKKPLAEREVKRKYRADERSEAEDKLQMYGLYIVVTSEIVQ